MTHDDDLSTMNEARQRRVRITAWVVIIALILGGGGATVFAGFYGAGTALDAVSFVLPLGAETPCAAAVNPASLAATGASVPAKGVLAVLLLSVGAGLVLVARRRTV